MKFWTLPKEVKALEPYIGKPVVLEIEEVPEPRTRLWDLRTYRLVVREK